MALSDAQLREIPSTVRPSFNAARRAVRVAAPNAAEVAYQSSPPRSRRSMWKIVRYTVGGAPVIGIGVFPTYASMFFYRGRELDDGSGLLEGGGKDLRFVRLRSPEDAERAAIRRVVRKAFRLGGS